MRNAGRVLRSSATTVAAILSALLFASCGGDSAETILHAAHDASFSDATDADASDSHDSSADSSPADASTHSCGLGACQTGEVCWCTSPVVCCPIGTLCYVCPDAAQADSGDASAETDVEQAPD